MFITIKIAIFSYGNSDIDKFLYNIRANINNDYYQRIANYMNDFNENSDPLDIYDFVKDMFSNNIRSISTIEWIPFSQITNLIKIAEGGFGIIYKATRFNKTIAVKRYFNSQNISKYFLMR